MPGAEPVAFTLALHPADWGVLALYGVLLVGAGWWFSRHAATDAREYFLGERRIPVWAAAISLIATTLSGATFIGAPQISFDGDLTYLATNIGSLIAVLVVAFFFIPAFYKNNVTSIYELIGTRFGPGAKLAASCAFMGGRVLASGARLYIGAIPLALILFGDRGNDPTAPQLMAAIGVITLVAVVYTLAGGIKSVIWTEVAQTGVLLAAVIGAMLLLLHRIPAPLHDVVSVLQTAGESGTSKLRVLDAGRGWHNAVTHAYSLPAVLIGFTLFGVAAYGTDHDLVQRTLTCRSALRGGQSAVAAIVIGTPIVALFMGVGLLLFIFYKRPDIMGAAGPAYDPGSSRKVFLTFILREMPRGMSGLMIAGLLSVGISSLSSALNAMSATFVKDVYSRLRPGADEATTVRVGKRAVAAWGLVLAAFACVCIFWQRAGSDGGTGGVGLIDFALGVMTFAYAGLLAVFLAAIFTRRGTGATAVAAMILGAAVVALMQPGVWRWWTACTEWTHTHLGAFTPAWPWALVVATAVAFTVCIARPSARGTEA